MKPFTKREIMGVAIIIGMVFFVTMRGLLLSERRARDAQRRGDLEAINNALYEFNKEFGYFPPSEDGKIKACRADNFVEILAKLESSGLFDQNTYFQGLRACEWGRDALKDVSDLNHPAYLQVLPKDPHFEDGVRYLYFSNLNRYQIYSYLEGGDDENGYDKGIVNRGLKCGNKTCSFGKSFYPTPLDRSIEDYEAELLEAIKAGKH